LAGQVLCGYTLMKRQDSIAWRESSSAFLFFAVGAGIALVGQIFNVPGEPEAFLLTWMLLCLPLIYLMDSSITSLLYISGITYYATHLGYWSYPLTDASPYWLLFVGALPHYYRLYRNRPESNFMIFHNWLLPLSLIICLGTVAKRIEDLMIPAYMSIYGLCYLIGNLDFFNRQRLRNNGFKVLGALGTISLLLMVSFDSFWEELGRKEFPFKEVMAAPEFYASVIASLVAGVFFYFYQKMKSLRSIKPLAPVFILFIAVFLYGLS